DQQRHIKILQQRVHHQGGAAAVEENAGAAQPGDGRVRPRGKIRAGHGAGGAGHGLAPGAFENPHEGSSLSKASRPYSASPASHSATSLSLAEALKRIPSCQSPEPASWARFSALLPRPELAEVQNGITRLPEKSLPVTKPLTGQPARPHQMGQPTKTVS